MANMLVALMETSVQKQMVNVSRDGNSKIKRKCQGKKNPVAEVKNAFMGHQTEMAEAHEDISVEAYHT